MADRGATIDMPRWDLLEAEIANDLVYFRMDEVAQEWL